MYSIILNGDISLLLPADGQLDLEKDVILVEGACNRLLIRLVWVYDDRIIEAKIKATA